MKTDFATTDALTDCDQRRYPAEVMQRLPLRRPSAGGQALMLTLGLWAVLFALILLPLLILGQLLRPTSDGRVQFASTPVLDPGAELKVKFSFHPDSGTTPARVAVVEGAKRTEFRPR